MVIHVNVALKKKGRRAYKGTKEKCGRDSSRRVAAVERHERKTTPGSLAHHKPQLSHPPIYRQGMFRRKSDWIIA